VNLSTLQATRRVTLVSGKSLKPSQGLLRDGGFAFELSLHLLINRARGRNDHKQSHAETPAPKCIRMACQNSEVLSEDSRIPNQYV
jgi:hypothetical protein